MKNSKRQRLTSQRKVEIVALASEVFTQYFSEPPANPLDVFSDHGITHSFGHYEDCFDGLLEYEGDEFHVYCNLDRENIPGSARARFTLAHELAHYFIDEHRIALMSGRVKPHPSKENEPTVDLLPEQEADLFASFFLMPQDLCSRASAKMGTGYEAIKKLATMFDVSLHCAAIRYVESKSHPGALIFWNKDGYAWKRVSDDLWRMGCRKSVEEPDQIVRDSATDRIMRSHAVGVDVHDSHSTLGNWFPKVERPAVRELIVREQAIRLGRFGVLTLIEPLNVNQTAAELRFATLSDTLAHWSSS